ncbi:MAG: leucyl aminopeptidase [Betaproteobacteria bacterium]|nr:leucyl aminopeptidase [Betaproteobacteria bacterium]
MEFSINAQPLEKAATGCVVVGVSEGARLSPAARQLDQLSQRHLSRLLKQGDLSAKTGKTLLVHGVPGIASARVLLVGTGSGKKLSVRDYRTVVRSAVLALDGTGATSALFCLAELEVEGQDEAWKLEQLVLTARDASYRVTRVADVQDPACTLKKVLLPAPHTLKPAEAKTLIARCQAIANGMALTRDLGNLPPNLCTPTYLANQARSLGRSWKLRVQVLEQKDMEKLGMGALLAVSSGSRQPPKLIVMQYSGAPKARKPIVLVGKGITFDTGGISLKPAPEMDEMKFDMCGAASVFGTVRAVAEMGLPINLIGVVPTCENMPDGNATRPGDIVRSMSGQTVEILNTDAEGRLILCDALTYAERFQPDTIIDVATLTGACVIALGNEAAGLFANDDALRDELQTAGDYMGDRAWPLPLWEEYQEGLKSNFADMANIAGRAGGTITAASFLSRFTRSMRWAHLDIAGVAYKGGKDKGATGRPVKLFCRYLIERSGR